MIQAKDLRIGNIIRYSTHILTVDTIRKDGYVSTKEKVDGYLEEYDGIEITPDILLRCGFEWETGKKTHMMKKVSDDRWISFYYNDDITEEIQFSSGWEQVGFSLVPKYLHQLQNLFFALTGQELEVRL